MAVSNVSRNSGEWVKKEGGHYCHIALMRVNRGDGEVLAATRSNGREL